MARKKLRFLFRGSLHIILICLRQRHKRSDLYSRQREITLFCNKQTSSISVSTQESLFYTVLCNLLNVIDILLEDFNVTKSKSQRRQQCSQPCLVQHGLIIVSNIIVKICLSLNLCCEIYCWWKKKRRIIPLNYRQAPTGLSGFVCTATFVFVFLFKQIKRAVMLWINAWNYVMKIKIMQPFFLPTWKLTKLNPHFVITIFCAF